MPAPAAEPDDEEDEVLCRYCFEGPEAGELLSPCECKGGQKWVHLSCLRRWQRMVLVSQPTHPAFYERDPRHHECNVCKSKFTCPPPHTPMTLDVCDVMCSRMGAKYFGVQAGHAW